MADQKYSDEATGFPTASYPARRRKANMRPIAADQATDEILLGANDAAHFLGIHRSTLHLAVRRELLQPDSTTPGGHHRFSLATLEKFRERLRTEPITTDPVASRHTQTLAQVTHAIATGEPGERVAQLAVRLLCRENAGAHMVCVALHTPGAKDHGALRLLAQEGFPDWFFNDYARLRPSLEQASVRALYTREPVVSQDCRTNHDATARLASRAGIRSYVVLPVARGQDVYGVLVVASRVPRHFLTAEVAFLRGIADALVIAYRSCSVRNDQVWTNRLLRATRALTDRGVELSRNRAGSGMLSATRWPQSGCSGGFSQQVQDALVELGELFQRETGAVEVCALGFDRYHRLMPTTYELSAATCAACADTQLLHRMRSEGGRTETVLAASACGQRGERAGVAARWAGQVPATELEHTLLIAFAGAVTLVVGAADAGASAAVEPPAR